MFLTAIKLQEDLIGRENQVSLVKEWMVFERRPAQDLHCNDSLLALRKRFERLYQLAGCAGHALVMRWSWRKALQKPAGSSSEDTARRQAIQARREGFTAFATLIFPSPDLLRTPA
ncbi:MAG TPA: hypothetical protein VI669_11475 [Vicinamibacteria bacterium]